MYKVLICEDEYLIRKGIIFSTDWEKNGCVVAGEADNGEDGIEKIKELKPDIVITDINMPIISGLAMIEATYEEFDYSVIILTGYNDFNYAQKAIRYGVSEYLLKPVEQDEMDKAIQHAIEQLKMRKHYQHQVESKEAIRSIQLLDVKVQLDSSDDLVNRMVEYIQENYMNKITMKELSEVFSYSETLLNKRFKDGCGTTFNDYLNKVRIQKAIDAMQDESRYVYDIATDCGFKDYKYFTIVFKKYIGCSPKEFMKALK